MKSKMVLIGMLLGLGGCSHMASIADAETDQQDMVADELTRGAKQLAGDSARLAGLQDSLTRDMEARAAQPPAPAPVPEYPQIPKDGTLGSKTFAMSMQDARIGQLLWILAMEFNLGLSIDPSVLESTRTVNLYLKDVTGRQALIHILKAFDVYGTVGSDNVLRVSPLEERIFVVDALAVKGALDVQAGGDAMGSSSSQGSSGMSDSVRMTGGMGDDKVDVWTGLSKTLDVLLAHSDGEKSDARFVMDRASGSLYVKARPSKIQAVAQMLEKSKAFRSRQVQIDAQLLDVTLDDGAHLGINWTGLGRRVMANLGASPISIGGAGGTVGQASSLLDRSITIPSSLMGVTGGGGGGITLSNRVFSATINALKSYGKVKLISNPSVRVNNGMPAYLSVGTNFRYIKEITSAAATTVGGNTPGAFMPITMEVKTDSVFSGVVLGLGAVVKDGGEIELFVRPSQTQVERESLALVDIGNSNRLTLPVVNTKSITTMLNVRDGDVVVLGGLVDQSSTNGREGLPGLSDMPGLGALFRSSSETSNTRELVMILRARIVQ